MGLPKRRGTIAVGIARVSAGRTRPIRLPAGEGVRAEVPAQVPGAEPAPARHSGEVAPGPPEDEPPPAGAPPPDRSAAPAPRPPSPAPPAPGGPLHPELHQLSGLADRFLDAVRVGWVGSGRVGWAGGGRRRRPGVAPVAGAAGSAAAAGRPGRPRPGPPLCPAPASEPGSRSSPDKAPAHQGSPPDRPPASGGGGRSPGLQATGSPGLRRPAPAAPRCRGSGRRPSRPGSSRR